MPRLASRHVFFFKAVHLDFAEIPAQDKNRAAADETPSAAALFHAALYSRTDGAFLPVSHAALRAFRCCRRKLESPESLSRRMLLTGRPASCPSITRRVFPGRAFWKKHPGIARLAVNRRHAQLHSGAAFASAPKNSDLLRFLSQRAARVIAFCTSSMLY